MEGDRGLESASGGTPADGEREGLWAAFFRAPCGTGLTATDGRVEAANPAFCRLLGRPAAELRRLRLPEAAHPEDAPALEALLRAAASGQDEGAPLEVRFVQPSGTVTCGLVRLHGVGGGAAPRTLVVHAEDATERRQAEDLLHENEEKFRIAFENAPTGMSLVRANGQYLAVNQALCEMFGYGREELLAGTIYRITHPDDVERSNQWIRKVISGDLSEPALEKRYIHRDGHVVWGVVRARWLREADGRPRFSVVHIQDVTERKRAEEERERLQAQLHRAQKMEAIGHLAGGIAHDFNNLLTAIGGNASVALTEPGLTEPVRAMLAEISQAVGSAANLTRQLLAFSRRQVIAPRVLDLNDVVRGLQRLLQRLLGEDLELSAVLAPDLGNVRIDPGQVEQILVNLAVNARDAMAGGGKLTLETANVRLDEAYARTRPSVAPGPYVLLAVSDDGAGMSEETRARIFEPFYTTKAQGKGTGLGLAMVYGAVKQNGGHIEVYSELGQGTTFKVYLPRVDAPAEAWATPAPGAVAGGTETILLAEDDPAVRSPAVRMLEHLGYTVRAFSSGTEALAAEPGLPPDVHLLVTDVVMPGINGRQLADRLVALRPRLRVLFTSGYTHNVIAHHGVLERGLEFLPKPYTLETLARRVREVLDAPLQSG